ncbi:hypothetical protein [Bacillus atrophaeus]|uniref:hypothetical protein n=1 Tax=Bacillus atrophaeus TaxID=1452 RepID=UPI00227DD79A|nr:hypothetical protein [Bacillus atrophaeus]MCY8823633.1 hypothetical protein [Bacillus atrophaeus]MCY8841273.1 hypothetical protein [Bacillus atrophaeus]MEC0805528.1 hypothetical protein [Bacillus atrophaeus]MEC0853444.1 hypothetical protein [Bacillus atrophaeus]MEC0856571.1 hypothetical protein [Bacillus atrophaeus]
MKVFLCNIRGIDDVYYNRRKWRGGSWYSLAKSRAAIMSVKTRCLLLGVLLCIRLQMAEGTIARFAFTAAAVI